MEYEDFRRSVISSVASILAKHRGSVARIKSRDIARMMGVRLTPVKAYTVFIILRNNKSIVDNKGRRWRLAEIFTRKYTGTKIAEYRLDL